MMCYRDMTFCDFWKTCGRGATCPSALTPKVNDDVKEFVLPICFFASKPQCYQEMENVPSNQDQ